MDDFEAVDAAWQKYQSAKTAAEQKKSAIRTNHQLSTDRINRQIAAYEQERDEAVRICNEKCRPLIAERQRLIILTDAETARVEKQSSETTLQALFDWSNAFDRMQAVSIIDLAKYRCFLRLQPTHPESANRLVGWIDKYIRPFIARFVPNKTDLSKFSYQLLNDDRPVYVDLPTSTAATWPAFASPRRRFGQISTHANSKLAYESNVGHVEAPSTAFRFRDAPWLADPPAQPDRFGFGRLALAANLTAVGRDLRCLVSDGGVEPREAGLLMACSAPSKRPFGWRRKRPKRCLLDYWLVCLPAVVVRLVLDYVYRTRLSGRRYKI